MAAADFDDAAPTASVITPYDERHMVTYLRLIDADSEGADWREVVSIVFGVNPSVCEQRAKEMHASHLARARWMSETGYRQLAKLAPRKPDLI